LPAPIGPERMVAPATFVPVLTKRGHSSCRQSWGVAERPGDQKITRLINQLLMRS
jgi:hypothetical protein